MSKRVGRTLPHLALIGMAVAQLMSCVTARHAAKATAQPHAALDGSCLPAYEKIKQASPGFVGYGQGLVDQIAVDNATQDLVRQIRTRVESQSWLEESNRSASYDALTTHHFSELLVGLVVEKRCQSNGQREAVVSLQKSLLIKNLTQRLHTSLAEVERLHESMTAAKTPAPKFQAAHQAKIFLSQGKQQTQDDLSLCQAFGGCSDLSLASLRSLESTAHATLRTAAFLIEAEDEDAKAVLSAVSAQLSADGFLLGRPTDESNRLRLHCFRKEFPQIAGTGYMITEIACTATASLAGEVAFSTAFAGKGMGHSRAEALTDARRGLAVQPNLAKSERD